MGDYYSIELFDDNYPNPIHEFGDHYHDNGSDKLKGFILGLEYLGYEINVITKQYADKDY